MVDEYDHEGRETAIGSDPLGTLLYMAPEQLQSQSLRPACDLYAVGLIAREMVRGHSVFEGKTRSQMMMEKVTRKAGFTPEPAMCPNTLAVFIEASTRRESKSRPIPREALAMLGFAD
jgi:eukaryotic-like serine/threonine-protein kinase